ncbi:MAG: NAD-dependent epimerase/dehydratase family protein [Sutterellaceae bacterium]|nr:NAD-dependent epimerase/dehydratase family protein [Burkholderiaceae bacterium]MCX7901116.1 NAD-dependent epimerase/dehydratase family protein [Burkholderiaceae bacterium]MDW8429574.1 NAD-dependent epimerase/dehydratase family protein [Sutterellaceae bacterium]
MTQPNLPPLADLLHEDLDYICSSLRQELPRLAGKQVLITGGAGFLGYYLVQAALHFNCTVAADQPIRITVWDSFARGRPPWLEALAGTPHLTVQQRDITQPLPEKMPDFAWIIHAAGIASPPFYRKYPLQTIDANIIGLRNLLDWSVRQRERGRLLEGFLFYSSSEIYGDPSPDAIPTREDYRGFVSCTGPRACYDESKRFGETLCVVFAQQFGVPTRIARPFNNYGPGLKITDKRVIPDFARDVLNGRDIVMWSDGRPTRTFCYVADAIIGYYKVLVRGRDGEPYNIGIDRPEISMAELAQKIIALASGLFAYRGRLVHKANPEAVYLVDNPYRRCPDISKARRELGYEPRILIDEGLRRALVWYHYHREAEEA